MHTTPYAQVREVDLGHIPAELLRLRRDDPLVERCWQAACHHYSLDTKAGLRFTAVENRFFMLLAYYALADRQRCLNLIFERAALTPPAPIVVDKARLAPQGGE